MKAELAFLNGFELHINIREKRERLPDVENVMPADVEICRTVFADNLPVMDYNDHKHNWRRHKGRCRTAGRRAVLPAREHCGRNHITGGFAMLEGLAADTRVITYLMAAVGGLGIIAKIVNHFTLNRLVKAAGNMPKSTHRLIKLVRAKYEHACMIRDSVENIDAFVEKYIYEYRGFLLRIHTWRQIEILSVWFAGILAALGASVLYFYSGFSESVYQYIAAGIAEVVLLSVIMRLSDEPYKVNAVRMYMTDYLENICTFRLRRQNARERESIDVISAEGGGKGVQVSEENAEYKRPEYAKQEYAKQEYAKQESRAAGRSGRNVRSARAAKNQPEAANVEKTYTEKTYAEKAYAEPAYTETAYSEQTYAGASMADTKGAAGRQADLPAGKRTEENGLPINIEGEPRPTAKSGIGKEAARHAVQGRQGEDDDRPALRAEAIRQILEEFLA